MPTIYIDDQAYEVEDGENMLEACLNLDLDLPYFCWHPEMGSVGACRQCALVQYRDAEDTRGRIVMGCMTPVTDGARFSMQGEAPKEFRENVVESLMLNHPHDCPVCAEGGECHLQDMTVMVGHRDRRYRGKKNTHRNQYLGPLINHEMNRCISCYRCTRYYSDYAGGTDLAAQAAHDHVYFGRHEDGVLESEFAGNLVEVCPTGVFTDKPLVNDYTRKWDLQSAPSVCNGCALGCNISPGERYGHLKRVHNRFNREVNGYFLCDRGRYGNAHVNDENRAGFAGLRDGNGRYDAIQTAQAIGYLSDWCAQDKKVVAIGSPRASLESNYLLRKLVGAENFCSGEADFESILHRQIVDVLENGSVSTPSMQQVETADAVLILGEDVTNTAPRLALSIRQSVRNRAKQMATQMRIPLWQDEAVRNLAQDQLSPLFIAATSDTRLDDIAEHTIHLSPSDIARFGYAIASKLDSSQPDVDGFDSETLQFIDEIASTLKTAERPLIVSGSGMQLPEVIDAAASIAHGLDNQNTMLSYCVAESNSIGMALMCEQQPLTLSTIFDRASKGEIDTLMILENDLFRRATQAKVEQLFKTVEKVVVLDVTDTLTMSNSDLALPAASFLESEGTLVSSEGRAQRHYPVFLPADQRQPAWQWLTQLGTALKREEFANQQYFDEVMMACAKDCSRLSGIGSASPTADFRNRGMKIPRQTTRYSGRTAMRANISVHEPKQPEDSDTPFSFSMEGENGSQPGALLPFVWSPGWNSNQSLQKFQSEVGGAVEGGTAGARLIKPTKRGYQKSSTSTPEAHNNNAKENQWEAMPAYRIFGSDELSARSPAVAELISAPFVLINKADANKLGVVDHDTVMADCGYTEVVLKVQINPTIPNGYVAYSVGLPGSKFLQPRTMMSLRKVDGKARGDHV